MPLDTFYLPKESPSFVNFPVLRDEQVNIETLVSFALRVNSALVDYIEARYSKIDLNMDEVEQHITLCRGVCERLGMADNVPFDVLLELRVFQKQFQNIRLLYRTQGKNLIGTPDKTASEGSGL
jgi:hypothetical protein